MWGPVDCQLQQSSQIHAQLPFVPMAKIVFHTEIIFRRTGGFCYVRELTFSHHTLCKIRWLLPPPARHLASWRMMPLEEETVGNTVFCGHAELAKYVRNEVHHIVTRDLGSNAGCVTFGILTGFAPYGSPAEKGFKTSHSACNSGNYSVAERLLVPEANWVQTRHIGAVDGGLRGICDEATKQGHLLES